MTPAPEPVRFIGAVPGGEIRLPAVALARRARPVHLGSVMPRQTATTAKPLSLAERKARVAAIAKTATGKAKAGMMLIDFREPTAKERAFAETLVPAARRALARRQAKVA